MDEPNKTADMFTEQVSAPKLKPVMGFRDLVFFYIVAIFGVRLLPVAASAGPSIVTFFLISLLIFFIPMGLTVIDLSKRYPVDGALYVWSKKAFGDFHGYITAWTYWTANLAFFPSLLLFTSSHLFLILPGYEHLSQSPVALGLLSTVVVLMMLFINLVGMKVSTIFNNISGVATYIAVALILVIGIASWIKLGPATDLSFDNWIPSLGSIKDLVFLSTVVYMFAGLECASMLGDEVRDARKTIPRAIVTSGILITLMYIFASFSLLVAVPTETLNDLTGISDAVRTGVGQLGGASLSLVFGSLSSFLLVIMGLGGLSVWLATTARLPFVVGLDRYLPPAFGKLHPRYGTPYISLISLTVITIFLIALSALGEKAEQVYNILISLEIVTFLIPYLYMFGSVIKFEVDKKYRKQVHVPGGHKNALVAGIVGFLVIVASILLALVPGDDVEDPLNFYLTVITSLAINLTIGIALYLYAKRKRSK